MMYLQNKIKQSVSQSEKQLFVLIDPDKFFLNNFQMLVEQSNRNKVDMFLVGGSLITDGDFSKTVKYLKDNSDIPVCIFPGNFQQIDPLADAIFFLSLISGRNPDFLIGNQVLATPSLKRINIEVIPVGYLLVDGGKITTVQYVSNTMPIPTDKPEIAACTALAGEYLGMKLIFLDAGSGAINPIEPDFVSKVKANINVPLIVGGGIKTPQQAIEIYKSGADAIVIGNAAEQNPALIEKIRGI